MKTFIIFMLTLCSFTITYAQEDFETDVFKSKSGKEIKIYALMHSCIRIVYNNKEIQIDPVARLRDRIVNYAAMPKADYIFVTHEHADHFDAATLKLLSSEKTQLIMNKQCADMFISLNHYVDKNGSACVMANGDRLILANDFTVEAVPAYNITEEHLRYHPKGRDNGYVLTIDGLRIYIAGDTEDIPEMKDIKNIDIAFLPCNQPFTMTPEQMVKAAKVINPKVLFPYHYGHTDVSNIPAQLKNDGIDVRIRHYE